MSEAFYQKLRSILNDNQILIDEPLSKHTTFQIGGPADYLTIPDTDEQVAAVIKLCLKEEMPYYVIGNGSNLLVSDKGFRGTIVKLGSSFSRVTIDEGSCRVTAQSGILLSKLAEKIANQSFTGFEFASGIPGTLGGAVTMNAGAYDGEIVQVITGAKVLDEAGNILSLNKEELNLRYRKSIIQDKNYIVLEASFQFCLGDKEEIWNKINDLNARRRDKQPLEFPSAGSTFKRPVGFYAGKLIMDSGLRGYTVGNAQVSEKHCGFVINKGGATAEEVKALISDVIQIVYNKFGVKLEPEVKLLGEF
jgi:UDP-N-acetylmuramate dehydrogenase